MLTQKIKTAAIVILLPCFTGFATNSFAQANATNNAQTSAKVMVAGISGNSATVDQILANPTLTSSLPDSRVSSFSITLIPKDRFLIGPYKTQGDRITQKALDSLHSVAGKPVNIVFEDIKIIKNGKEIAGQTIFMKCKQ
ncbi:MAG: hypothetical protein JWQ38_3703 [Flavipsychrobacter sp.]|nr:hypothetical protein [Flavipsychrobacter sp.]